MLLITDGDVFGFAILGGAARFLLAGGRGHNPRGAGEPLRTGEDCDDLSGARRDGRDSANEMREVMVAVGWRGAKGDLTADAMVRNRMIAERLGCLNESGMADLQGGRAAVVRNGPYTGDKLSVDHVIPRAVCPELDTTLANLERMPLRMNSSKSDSVGERQVDMARRFYAAGLLSDAGLAAVLA